MRANVARIANIYKDSWTFSNEFGSRIIDTADK